MARLILQTSTLFVLMILQIGTSVPNAKSHLADDKGNLVDDQNLVRVKRAGGAITAAIIGATLSATTTGAKLATQDNEPRGSRGGCKWFGNGPWCGNPTCPSQDGYEVQDKRSLSGSIFKKWTSANRNYGTGCDEGHKKLCCRLRDDDKRWGGIWEEVAFNVKFTCTVKKCEALLQRQGMDATACTRCGLALECTNVKNDEWIFVIGPEPQCDRLVLVRGDIFYFTLESEENEVTKGWIQFKDTLYKELQQRTLFKLLPLIQLGIPYTPQSDKQTWQSAYYLVGKASVGKISFTTIANSSKTFSPLPDKVWNQRIPSDREKHMTWYKV